MTGVQKHSQGSNSELTHTYTDAGVYLVRVTGQVHLRDYSANASRNMSSSLCTDILAMGTGVEYQSCNAMFHSISGDKFSFEDVPDLSNCTTLDNMFFGCNNFNQPLNDWDVSNVQNFYRMFLSCSNFNQPLNNWSTDNMNNLSGTFYGCSSFNQDLDNWDVSQVGYFTSTFLNCAAFNGNVTTWDTSGATLMTAMFSSCHDFNQDVSGFDLSGVTAIDNMFANCHDFNQDLSAWDTSTVQNMYRTFINCLSMSNDVSTWNVEATTTYDQFNYNAANLTALKTPFFEPFTTKWTTVAPNTEIEIGFGTGNSDVYIDWGDGTTEQVTAINSAETHTYADAGNYVVKVKGSNVWSSTSYSANNDISSSICTEVSAIGKGVTYANMSSMFIDVTGDKFTHTDAITCPASIAAMFRGCTNFNQNIDNWNTSAVTATAFMFMDASSYNQAMSSWDVSNVQSFASMFQNATLFNQDISSWVTTSATSMNQMFTACTNFNQDLNGWDMNGVTDVNSMFRQTSMTYDLDNWDTSTIQIFAQLFRETQYNGDIAGWDTSAATNTIYMFQSNESFNQDISAWDMGECTAMDLMFSGASAMSQDLSNWDVSKVTSYATFGTSSGLLEHQLPSFGLVNDDLSVHFKISDTNNLYQDTAGIVPITADGQAVALIVDRSGNGNNATQSDVAKRPVYKTDGTYHWLEANGTNTIMEMPVGFDGALDGDNTSVSSVRLIGNGYNYVFGSEGDKGFENLFLNGLIRPFCKQSNASAVSNGTTFNRTTDRIYSSDYVNDNGSSVAELRGWNDQNLEANASITTADKLEPTASWLFQGYSTSSAGFFEGRLYELTIFNSQSSDAHRNIVEECLERRCNVVLP